MTGFCFAILLLFFICLFVCCGCFVWVVLFFGSVDRTSSISLTVNKKLLTYFHRAVITTNITIKTRYKDMTVLCLLP